MVELYEQQLVDRDGDDPSKNPQFDVSAWLAIARQLKKGRLFGFGSGMDAERVITSATESRCSAATYSFTQSPPPLPPPPPPPPPSQSTTDISDHYCCVLVRQLDSWFDQRVVPTLHAMGVAFPSSP